MNDDLNADGSNVLDLLRFLEEESRGSAKFVHEYNARCGRRFQHHIPVMLREIKNSANAASVN